MRTLEEIDQLEQSRFGRPKPRHGLKLLYWFATDCLSLDQNNVLKITCSPNTGDFGFHSFENRHERNGGRLLPVVILPYYLVGNLGYTAASKLPAYVRENYTRSQDSSNKDRIIISLRNKLVQTVFVTEHSDLSNFDRCATYRISEHLILAIRDLSLEEFLWRTGYSKQQPNMPSRIPFDYSLYLNSSEPSCPIPTPETSSNIPSSVSSTNQDICIPIESPTIMTNKTQHRPRVNENQIHDFVQDNLIQNLRISNRQPQPLNNQTSHTGTSISTSSTWIFNHQQDSESGSTCTQTTISSRNQDFNIDLTPVSQISSGAITEDTQTYTAQIIHMMRHCNCTIL